MPTVNMYEAKAKLSKLVEMAMSGTDVLIARRGNAVARITRMARDKRPIRSGLMEGEGWIADDFDWPLPGEIQAGFEGRR